MNRLSACQSKCLNETLMNVQLSVHSHFATVLTRIDTSTLLFGRFVGIARKRKTTGSAIASKPSIHLSVTAPTNKRPFSRVILPFEMFTHRLLFRRRLNLRSSQFSINVSPANSSLPQQFPSATGLFEQCSNDSSIVSQNENPSVSKVCFKIVAILFYYVKFKLGYKCLLFFTS